MEPLSYDVVIVGAHVAGSVLAARLGDGGMSVLLVDKASFPSPTITPTPSRTPRSTATSHP